MSDIRVKTW